jgi:hypothetical protein
VSVVIVDAVNGFESTGAYDDAVFDLCVTEA